MEASATSPSRYVCPVTCLALSKSIRSNVPQGKVYDVTGNKMYQPGNSYNGKWNQWLYRIVQISSHHRSQCPDLNFPGAHSLSSAPRLISPGDDALESQIADNFVKSSPERTPLAHWE